jgi:hypothetical protein
MVRGSLTVGVGSARGGLGASKPCAHGAGGGQRGREGAEGTGEHRRALGAVGEGQQRASRAPAEDQGDTIDSRGKE